MSTERILKERKVRLEAELASVMQKHDESLRKALYGVLGRLWDVASSMNDAAGSIVCPIQIPMNKKDSDVGPMVFWTGGIPGKRCSIALFDLKKGAIPPVDEMGTFPFFDQKLPTNVLAECVLQCESFVEKKHNEFFKVKQ